MNNILTRIVFLAPLWLKNDVLDIVTARKKAGKSASMKGVLIELIQKGLSHPEYQTSPAPNSSGNESN